MNTFNKRVQSLTNHEMSDVLAALRRDMRHESDLVASDPEWADWHRQNARRDKSLLQLLNPKQPTVPHSLPPVRKLLTEPGVPERFIPLPDCSNCHSPETCQRAAAQTCERHTNAHTNAHTPLKSSQ